MGSPQNSLNSGWCSGNRGWLWLKRFILLGFCVIGFGIAFVPNSWAQEPTAPVGENPPPIEQLFPSRSGLNASDISSEKISQFVQAYLKVVALIDRRESDLQGAETESESLQMQQEIQAEALQLIETEGLTVQEYLQLLGLANIDPEFGERVAAHLQEESE